MKNLCFKEHYQKNENTTHRMGENINELSDKGLLLGQYKELLKFNKINTPILKQFKKTFLQRGTLLDAQHH